MKLGLYEAGQWIDRNGNGTVETSFDRNGDGDISADEMLPWGQDECVLYEVVLMAGKEGTYVPGTYPGTYESYVCYPRSVAMDADGFVWLGCYGTKKYYRVNGETAQIEATVNLSSVGHTPYGAVVDAYGILWSSSLTTHVLRLNTRDLTFSTLPLSPSTYGIGLDTSNHVFVSGGALRQINVLTGVTGWSNSSGAGSGVATTADGDVWVAGVGLGVVRISGAGVLKKQYAVGATPKGVSVDSQGKVWVVNYGDEYIHRIDPATDTVDLSKRIIGGYHYGYSDMTGIVARGATTRLGLWTATYTTGTRNSPWNRLAWNATEPPGSSIRVLVRSSNDRLAWSAWESATNDVALSRTPPGKYLQLEANFQVFSGTSWPVLYELTINPDRPVILTQPESRTNAVNTTASFSVTASGVEPLRYQWLFNGTILPGATNAMLVLTNVQLNQAGGYLVIVANDTGSVTSAPPAVLTVGQLPQITASPASQSVWQGSTVSLAVTATGTAPLRYQWYRNGAAISGASGQGLVFTNAVGSQSGAYWVVVANTWGAATSAVATVTVTTLGDFLNAPGLAWTTRGAAPWFMQTNVTHDGVGALRSGAIGDSQESVLEAIVTGPGTLGFWWKVSSEEGSDFLKFYLNGVEQVAIAGEVDWERRTLAVPAGTVTLRWVYAKDLSFPSGDDAGWLDQVDFAQVFAPMIRQQPTNLVVLPGAAAAFNVSVEGTAPLQYQWRLNGQPLADGGGYNGVTTSNLLIASAQPAHTGNYTLAVTNQAGAATSQVARLTLLLTPVFTAWPTNRDVVVGSTVTLTASATSAVPPSYQWRFNDANLPGATNTSLTLTNVQASAEGLYVVVASNAAGVTSSPPARLAVWFPPQIQTQPQSQTVVGGGSLTLQVGAIGTTPLAYQWRLNSTNLSDGARISGATTNTLVITPIVRTDAGDYSVIVSNLALAVPSSTARVQVEPLRFQSVRWTTNGQVELRLLGEVGAPVKLQATTNFSQWTTLGTVTNHTGTLDYTTPGTNQPRRYYRAWMP